MTRSFSGGEIMPTRSESIFTCGTRSVLRNTPVLRISGVCVDGRVGIIGISYDGYTSLAALVDPHPALKAAVPINPMVDGWRGDDWFHNGTFRELNESYIYEQEGTRDNSAHYSAADASYVELPIVKP